MSARAWGGLGGQRLGEPPCSWFPWDPLPGQQWPQAVGTGRAGEGGSTRLLPGAGSHRPHPAPALGRAAAPGGPAAVGDADPQARPREGSESTSRVVTSVTSVTSSRRAEMWPALCPGPERALPEVPQGTGPLWPPLSILGWARGGQWQQDRRCGKGSNPSSLPRASALWPLHPFPGDALSFGSLCLSLGLGTEPGAPTTEQRILLSC